MGNEMSQEEEAMFLEEAYKMSLDNPDVDKKINAGTTAPAHQPKHTMDASSSEESDDDDSHGLEVVMSKDGDGPEFHVPDEGSNAPLPHKHRRIKSSNSSGSLGSGKRAPPRRASSESSSRRSVSDRRTSSDREEARKMSYLQMARLGYQELVNAIIRPPRADYKVEALGPPAFSFCGRRFTRTDFALKTKRGLNLQCSHWEPVERTSDRIPVVIYMHGNSSARLEVIPQLSYLLSLGLAVFSFDFAGSGKSDGDYVSLGYYEREDLMCVIAHLRATNVVSTIALWGRSMGAATALMHGDRDPSIACMILDSPFADLSQLAEEMVEKGKEQGITVPNLVVSVALKFIAGSVKRQANFNIKDISPIAHSDKCFIPALFVAGEHDDFINKRHSQAIHAKYAGDKNLIIVEGDHNSPRPKFMFDSVSIFLQTCLQIPESWALRVHPGMNLMAPPWFYPGTTQKAPKRSSSGSKSSGSRRGVAASRELRGPQRSRGPELPQQQEMGMTLERQREIQASLFKMLGQADDAPPKISPKSPTSAALDQPPSSAMAEPGSNRSRILSTHSLQSVNHAKTFPPPTTKPSQDDDDEEDDEKSTESPPAAVSSPSTSSD